MGYSVKWVTENLGITRDMLRHYEKEGLLPIDETRNPTNNYRNYSDEDIEKIWTIKLLIGIGFSTREIRSWQEDSDFSFYKVISEKVVQLEKRHDELMTYLEFAKTIKLTGRIPNISKLGVMKFDDFMEYSRKNWNMFTDPSTAPLTKTVDTLISRKPEEWSTDDIDRLIAVFGDFDAEQISVGQTIGGYYRVLADMKNFDYAHDTVQTVVHLLYEYTKKQIIQPQFREKYSPLYFADHTISSFIESGIAKLNERNYGKDGCLFIAQAIAHFGGYNLDI